MTTTKTMKRFAILGMAFLATAACFAGDDSQANQYAVSLTSVATAELPARTAALVKEAPAKEHARTDKGWKFVFDKASMFPGSKRMSWVISCTLARLSVLPQVFLRNCATTRCQIRSRIEPLSCGTLQSRVKISGNHTRLRILRSQGLLATSFGSLVY